MVAVLLDLTAKSPFPLKCVTVVDCADPRDLRLKVPSRRDMMRGVEEPGELVYGETTSRKKRIKNLIDEILDRD
jgi:hypothetical protein